jgi:toxin ParE1/3/4
VPAKFLVKIARTAEVDTEEIWTFIAQDSPDAADRFLWELDRQLVTLERLPERCSLIPENELMGTRYRHLVYLICGGYRTIFRVSGRTVVVLRIIHGARLLDSSMFDLHP